jgi:hypothetical protein
LAKLENYTDFKPSSLFYIEEMEMRCFFFHFLFFITFSDKPSQTFITLSWKNCVEQYKTLEDVGRWTHSPRLATSVYFSQLH